MQRISVTAFVLILVLSNWAIGQTQYTCYMNGANETPPNPSTGWGVGRFILSADQDSLYYSLFWKLPNPYSASHIHFGAPGVPGGIVFNLQAATATGSHGVWAIDATNLVRLTAGTLYVNVHSTLFPNGEIRAQILPGQILDNTYTSVLTGANEVPPNGSLGWGIGTYVLSPDQDTLYYSYLWKTTGTFTASHIHFAAPGVIGPAQHDLQVENSMGAHGAWAISATNVARLNAEQLYVNAHSSPTWLTGEIRDQIHYHPPQPDLQLSLAHLDFPPTSVAMSVQQIFTVTNIGGGTLSVTDIIGTNHVFSAAPSSFTLSAGQQQLVTVIFSPTFDHDFNGEFWVQSNDPQSPTTVTMLGSGCHPVQQPGLPILHDAGSADALYFALPWDSNDLATMYAVEVSADNFVNSWFIDEHGLNTITPEYNTLGIWGHESGGVILGLEPSTQYSVRLRAKDCTGATLTGPAATLSTSAEVHTVDMSELVIQKNDGDSVKLSWDPFVRADNGDTIDATGFAVYAGSSPDVIDELIGNSTLGEFTVPSSPSALQFFQVSPIIEDFSDAHPFIAWPPEGALLYGLNSVVIKDYLHSEQWDSFEVVVDPAGAATLIGTNWTDPVTEYDKATIQYDFDNLPVGLHVISFRVYDFSGQVILPPHDIQITVIRRPAYVNFTAEYVSAQKLFVCDTLSGAGLDSGFVDIWWQNTQSQEGYGPSFDFVWNGADSVNLVKPIPVIEPKALSENSITAYLNPMDNAGVIPVEGSTETNIGFFELSCCCDNLEILTAGNARGEYQSQKNRPLGPSVICANGKYKVSYAFEVVVTYKYFIVLFGGEECTYGQDAKRTDTRTVGRCTNDTTFTPVNPPLVDIDHHSDGGLEFPFAGGSYGSDHYGSRPGDTGVDESTLGRKSWYDRPENKAALPRNANGPLAVKVKRETQFFAKAAPQCDPVNIECCRQWNLSWEIVFCGDCSIRQVQPPAITNEVTPAECPALAE